MMDKPILGNITFSHPIRTLSEFLEAVNGIYYRAVLQELDEWLRQRIKYQEIDEARAGVLQEIRDKLIEILEGRNLTLWD